MSGIRDLATLLRRLEPRLHEDELVYCSIPTAAQVPPDLQLWAMIQEAEGTTLVVRAADAKRHALPASFACRCITLEVGSALDAVGLTAAVAGALSEAGIACNMIAGFHHDHVLVPKRKAARALAVLQRLAVSAARA